MLMKVPQEVLQAAKQKELLEKNKKAAAEVLRSISLQLARQVDRVERSGLK